MKSVMIVLVLLGSMTSFNVQAQERNELFSVYEKLKTNIFTFFDSTPELIQLADAQKLTAVCVRLGQVQADYKNFHQLVTQSSTSGILISDLTARYHLKVTDMYFEMLVKNCEESRITGSTMGFTINQAKKYFNLALSGAKTNNKE